MEFVKKSKWYVLIISLVLTAVGVCLIVRPELFTAVGCFIVGALLVVLGVVRTVTFFAHRDRDKVPGNDFAVALFMVLCGFVFLLRPDTITSILQTVVGVGLLADASFKYQVALDAWHVRARNWWVMLILASVTAVMGVLSVFFRIDAIMILLGAALIVDGVQNLVSLAFITRFFDVDREPEIIYYTADGDR